MKEDEEREDGSVEEEEEEDDTCGKTWRREWDSYTCRVEVETGGGGG